MELSSSTGVEFVHNLVSFVVFVATWAFIIGFVGTVFFFGVWAWHLIGQSRGWQ